MNKTIYLLILIMSATLSCSHPSEWQNVKYSTNLKCDSLNTQVEESEDMRYSIQCHAYFENDTLIAFIPHDLPGSWRSVTIKMYDGKFKAETDGIPFEPIELSFKTIKQELLLGKKQYALNDTLCASFDFVFQDIEKGTNQTHNRNFKGTVCEVIRDKNFDPVAGEVFMGFDLSTAIHEIGEPMNEETFNMQSLTEFRVELLNYLPSDKNIAIRELTWDISPLHDVSDEGRERLTIWYTPKNNKWIAVHYMKWSDDMEF